MQIINFSISYSDEEINLLVNNDKEQSNKILSKINALFNQFLNLSNNVNDIDNKNDDYNNSIKGIKKKA